MFFSYWEKKKNYFTIIYKASCVFYKERSDDSEVEILESYDVTSNIIQPDIPCCFPRCRSVCFFSRFFNSKAYFLVSAIGTFCNLLEVLVRYIVRIRARMYSLGFISARSGPSSVLRERYRIQNPVVKNVYIPRQFLLYCRGHYLRSTIYNYLQPTLPTICYLLLKKSTCWNNEKVGAERCEYVPILCSHE